MKKEATINNKIDKRKIFTRIMAAILAILTILATCSTLIYYIVAGI